VLLTWRQGFFFDVFQVNVYSHPWSRYDSSLAATELRSRQYNIPLYFFFERKIFIFSPMKNHSKTMVPFSDIKRWNIPPLFEFSVYLYCNLYSQLLCFRISYCCLNYLNLGIVAKIWLLRKYTFNVLCSFWFFSCGINYAIRINITFLLRTLDGPDS